MKMLASAREGIQSISAKIGLVIAEVVLKWLGHKPSFQDSHVRCCN